MATRAQLDRLFLGLAAATGDARLKLSPEGSLFCTLGEASLSFHHADDGPLFLLAHAGDLRALGPLGQEEAMLRALNANVLWQGSAGGSFGLDASDRLMLSLRLEPPGDLSPEDEAVYLAELLAPFVGAAEWGRQLCEPESGRDPCFP